MREGKGEKKMGGIEIVKSEKKKDKRKTKEQTKDDESGVGEKQEIEDQEQQRKEREGKQEGGEGEQEREKRKKRRREKEEEEKKKRFECGICLELMNWEKEPRLLPCCGLSFCSLCLTKLFLLQNPPSPSSSSSSSSSPSPPSSSPSLKGVKCPVCCEMNECESVETLSMNYLIPETIDVLLSSNLISFSNPSIDEKETKIGDGGMECANFETCGEQTRMFCSKCDMFICDSCDPSHTSTIFTRNHKRSERDGRRRLEEGVMGLENLKKRECSKHPSETICGYCFQCSSFVCTRCILGTHDDHRKKVKSIEESILEKKNEVVKIGDKLERRLIFIERKRKRIEEEMKELEEKLEKKRIEKKEIELEKEDLRIRKDSIIRLSNTPTTTTTTTTDCDVSLFFDDQLFSTLLQIANDIVFEGGVVGLLKPKKGVICCDGGGDSFRFVSSFPLKNQPLGVSVNSDGNIFICQFDGPRGVDVDEEGRIIVCDTFNHRIQVFDNDGSFLRSFGSKGSSDGQFNGPYRVVVDRDGNIVISDCSNHRIQVMDIEGNFIRCFGTKGSGDSQFDSPEGVDVDGEGRIVVCDRGNERVSVFEKDGTFLFSFGKGSMKEPNGIVIDSFGTIIVSDYEKESIKLWNT